jgi:hypothetical protein
MSKPIIEALRPRRDIKRTVRDTAKEIAHRASIYGVARVSLSYLADKCGCCKQTIINHINILIEARILRKKVVWIRNNFCEINVYTFIITWHKTPVQMCNSQNSRQNLPPQGEREKFGTIREEIRLLKQGLRVLSEGLPYREDVEAKIRSLTALLGDG